MQFLVGDVGVLGFDVDGRVAHLAQPAHHQARIVGLERSLQHFAGAVTDPVGDRWSEASVSPSFAGTGGITGSRVIGGLRTT